MTPSRFGVNARTLAFLLAAMTVLGSLLLAGTVAGCSDSNLIGLQGDINVEPDSLVFDSVTLGTVETQDVKIMNTGNGDLEVSELSLRVGASSLSLAHLGMRLGAPSRTRENASLSLFL